MTAADHIADCTFCREFGVRPTRLAESLKVELLSLLSELDALVKAGVLTKVSPPRRLVFYVCKVVK